MYKGVLCIVDPVEFWRFPSILSPEGPQNRAGDSRTEFQTGGRSLTELLELQFVKPLPFLSCGIFAILLSGCALNEGRETRLWQESAWKGLEDTLPVSSEALGAGRQTALQEIQRQSALTLEDCYRLALLYSNDLAIQGEDYLQSVFSRDRALADLLPYLSFQGSYTRAESAISLGGVAFGPKETENYYFQVRQTLFDGFHDYFSYRQAGKRAAEREYQMRRGRDLILLAVAEAFYRSLQLQQSIAAREQSVRVQENQLRRIEAEFEAGVARSSEILLSRANLEQDRAELVTARQEYRSTRNTLSLLMGWWTEQELTDNLEIPGGMPSVEALKTQAWQGRADLAAASAALEAAEQGVRAAVARFAPQIQLGGNSWTHREGSSEDVDWELGISGEIPVFDGGLRVAELRSARSQRRQARERLATIQKQIRFELEDLHGKLISQDQAIAAAEAQLNAASQAYEQVWAEYREGEATNLEVITAENLRLSAEIRYDQELLRKKVLWLQLQVAAGSAPGTQGEE